MRSYFEPPPSLNTPPPDLPPHQILADYYAERPGEVAKLSVLCVQLYSNAHFPSIFALLFHIWLLELGPDHRNAVSLFTVCVVVDVWRAHWVVFTLFGTDLLTPSLLPAANVSDRTGVLKRGVAPVLV